MNKSALRTALSLFIVGLYVAGLIAMFAQNLQLGLWLWVISTAGGVGLLYWMRVMNKRAEDAEKIAKGMPYGEPDDPAAPVEPVAPAQPAAPDEGDGT